MWSIAKALILAAVSVQAVTEPIDIGTALNSLWTIFSLSLWKALNYVSIIPCRRRYASFVTRLGRAAALVTTRCFGTVTCSACTTRPGNTPPIPTHLNQRSTPPTGPMRRAGTGRAGQSRNWASGTSKAPRRTTLCGWARVATISAPSGTPTPPARRRSGTRRSVRLESDPRGLMAFKSPDGIHWSVLQEDPIIPEKKVGPEEVILKFDTQNVAFWDEVKQEYRTYVRGFHKDLRVVCTATSKDFRNWTTPVLLDFGDTQAPALYTNQVKPYYRAPHIYIGFPARYSDRGWSKSMRALPMLDHRENVLPTSAGLAPRSPTACSSPVAMASTLRCGRKPFCARPPNGRQLGLRRQLHCLARGRDRGRHGTCHSVTSERWRVPTAERFQGSRCPASIDMRDKTHGNRPFTEPMLARTHEHFPIWASDMGGTTLDRSF